jgi:hypothetical protein
MVAKTLGVVAQKLHAALHLLWQNPVTTLTKRALCTACHNARPHAPDAASLGGEAAAAAAGLGGCPGPCGRIAYAGGRCSSS